MYNVHWVTSIFTSRPVCDIWLFAAKGVVVLNHVCTCTYTYMYMYMDTNRRGESCGFNVPIWRCSVPI